MQLQLIELIKTEDFEHFQLKSLPPQKNSPDYFLFIFEFEFGVFAACCFVCILLFRFAYTCILQL